MRVSSSFFLVVVATLCSHCLPTVRAVGRDDDEPKTYWAGKLETEGRHFRFVISVEASADSNQQATLLSLDEGERRFPLSDFQVDETSLSFKLPGAKAEYSGQINPATQVADGFWQQGGAKLALRLERSTTVPVDTPAEVWQGTLKTGLRDLVMQFRVYQDGDGRRHYFVDSLTEKVGGIVAKEVDENNRWHLEIPLLRASFLGEQSDEADLVKGDWKQTLSIPLELRRVEADQAKRVVVPAISRPQTPQPPFPYQVREVQFASAVPQQELFGTLTLPMDAGPHPLAILISGSGPQDRDSTILDHKPFWVLADYLTRQGIAVLRYDERGVGKSPGDFASATTQDFAEDVESAIRFARTLAEIDKAKVGLIGHSEGGLVATMVAAQDPELAWIVLMAAPGVTGEQILFSQGQLVVAAEGGSDLQLQQQRQIQELVFAAVKQHPAESWTSELADSLSADIIAKMVPDDQEASGETDREQMAAAVRNGLTQINSPWFRFFLNFDPGPSLAKVRCPVLALNGSHDLQVDPKLNLPKIEAALRAGGNTVISIKELPGLNHLFQTCDTGAISKYAQHEETMAPVALQTIAEWIDKHVSTTETR